MTETSKAAAPPSRRVFGRLIGAIVGGAGVLVVSAALVALLLARGLFAAPGAIPLGHDLGALPEGPVLAVFAHPDDEILASQLLANAAAAGRSTALYTATRGEAGTQMPVIARQDDLGVVRKAEALKHSFSLGVERHVVDGFRDGGVAQTPERALEAAISAELDAVAPSVVVTFWPPSGVSMHPDHRRIGEITQRLTRARASQPGGPQVLVYALAPDRALRRLGGAQGLEVADNQPQATHALAARAGAKRAAWRIHASQADYVAHAYGVPAWLLYALWGRELYHVEVLAPAETASAKASTSSR